MKIVFGVMSAVHSAQSIGQLAGALAPYSVVLHHDFAQTPEFRLERPNVKYVKNPMRTGWGVWGFSEGIMHLLDHCLHVEQADYFQLLSPTCLPIRRPYDFARFLAADNYAAHISSARIMDSSDLFMNFAYRAYLPAASVRFRALRKVSDLYFGKDATEVSVANLQTKQRDPKNNRFAAQMALRLTGLARGGWFGEHAFSHGLEPKIGGTWFGCHRDAGLYLLARMRDARLRDHFSKMWIPDEMLFASILGGSKFQVGPSNHLVNRFEGANPRWIEQDDLDALFKSGKFFARKFKDDPSDRARLDVLNRLLPDNLPTRVAQRPIGVQKAPPALADASQSN